MNILKFELRKYLPSSLVWAIALGCFSSLCLGLFNAFTADLNFFRTMLNAYSPEFLQAFGAQVETIETLPGFYSFCFMYIVLCGALEALYLGICSTSNELSGKSADFLYTKPMKRSHILTWKLFNCLLCIIIVNIIYNIITLYMAYTVQNNFNSTLFILINSGLFLTQLLFLCFGFCLGCIMKKVKTPLSLTSGIICAFFLLQMLVNLEPNGILSYFSFLSYTSADSIMANNGFDTIRLCLLISLSICFLISGYLYFQKRDIHTL